VKLWSIYTGLHGVTSKKDSIIYLSYDTHNIICETKSTTSSLLILKKLNMYISLTEQYTLLACIFNSPLLWPIKPF